MITHTIPDLLDDYLATLIAWDSAQKEAKTANRLYRHLADVRVNLKADLLGRQGISELMKHQNIGVRLMAASDSLEWDADAATVVLERIQHGPGLYAVDAKYILKAFHEKPASN
jgi:hypothetical protein